MKRLLFPLVLLCLLTSAVAQELQADSGISLHIIGDELSIDPKTGTLSFSYYYENKTANNAIVIDYYEPCPWELPKVWADSTDSVRFLGLRVVLMDELGNELLPSDTLPCMQTAADSAKFYKSYYKERKKGYQYHTRVLRPHDALINLFYLRLNRRKCHCAKPFLLEPGKHYQLYLQYEANPEVSEKLNYSFVSAGDVPFVGTLKSNKVLVKSLSPKKR